MKNILRIADEKSDKIQIIMALLLIAASAIPLLFLCRYAVPIADDFFVAINMSNTNVIESTINMYLKWQGTYAARFCEIFNFFGFFGVRAYSATCAATILIHLGAWLFAIRSVLVNVFSCNKWSCTLWIYSAVVYYLANFFHPGETFFWQGGATVYTYPLSMILFAVGFYAMTSHATKRRKVVYTVIAALCLFWACGGTALTAAVACSVFLYCSVQSLFNKGQNRGVTFVLFVCCLAFTLLNILAPGNFARQSTLSDLREAPTIGVFGAFMDSFTAAIPRWINYAEQFAVISLLLALPCREIIKASDRKIFRWPLASFMFVLSAVVVCIFPLAFGYGTTELVTYIFSRYFNTFNSVFFGAVLFLVILFWGWLYKITAAIDIGSNKKQKQRLLVSVFSVYVAALLLIGLNYTGTHAKSLNTIAIIEDMRNGTLKNYKELNNAAFEYAANTEEVDIIITLPEAYRLFGNFPYSGLVEYDLFAEYFGLNSVSVTVQGYVPPIE